MTKTKPLRHQDHWEKLTSHLDFHFHTFIHIYFFEMWEKKSLQNKGTLRFPSMAFPQFAPTSDGLSPPPRRFLLALQARVSWEALEVAHVLRKGRRNSPPRGCNTRCPWCVAKRHGAEIFLSQPSGFHPRLREWVKHLERYQFWWRHLHKKRHQLVVGSVCDLFVHYCFFRHFFVGDFKNFNKTLELKKFLKHLPKWEVFRTLGASWATGFISFEPLSPQNGVIESRSNLRQGAANFRTPHRSHRWWSSGRSLKQIVWVKTLAGQKLMWMFPKIVVPPNHPFQ